MKSLTRPTSRADPRVSSRTDQTTLERVCPTSQTFFLHQVPPQANQRETGRGPPCRPTQYFTEHSKASFRASTPITPTRTAQNLKETGMLPPPPTHTVIRFGHYSFQLSYSTIKTFNNHSPDLSLPPLVSFASAWTNQLTNSFATALTSPSPNNQLRNSTHIAFGPSSVPCTIKGRQGCHHPCRPKQTLEVVDDLQPSWRPLDQSISLLGSYEYGRSVDLAYTCRPDSYLDTPIRLPSW